MYLIIRYSLSLYTFGSISSFIKYLTRTVVVPYTILMCFNKKKILFLSIPFRLKTSLNTCQICCHTTAKYRCPRCEIKTCSLPCVKQHKVTSGCTGERDKTAFVDISCYSDKDLLNGLYSDTRRSSHCFLRRYLLENN